MKKYQLWLERKSYSQHLFNLMKIKNSQHSFLQKLEHPTTPIRSPNLQNSTLTKYKKMEDNQISSQKFGDASYATTYKKLKNRKLRIMKTFQITNQNMSMARRINGVKSALLNSSKEKTISQHNNNKRRLFEKKCELSNDQIRQQNFKKFIKWQSNKTSGIRPYYLTLTVQNITKIMNSHHQYAAAWCQISTDKGFVRSELVPLDEFQGHKLFFTLYSDLPKDCLFRLYICKGLKSQIIGQFQFRRPEVGQTTVSSYRSDDGQFQAQMNLHYSKIKKQRYLFNLK